MTPDTADTRRTFHQQLADVRSDLVRAGALVIEAIARGTEILLDNDVAAAEQLIQADAEVNQRTLSVEDRCYRLLALQQPVAADLRAIVTAIRLSSEIERSGDLVVNICKGSRRLSGQQLDPKLRGLINKMSEQAHLLYRSAIDAYAEGDAELAAALNDADDVLDNVHSEYIQTIFESHATSRIDLQVGVQLALIGRFYERIGDHAVNIGDRVTYMITGQFGDFGSSVRDGESIPR
jgi:phosphate transport system protein